LRTLNAPGNRFSRWSPHCYRLGALGHGPAGFRAARKRHIYVKPPGLVAGGLWRQTGSASWAGRMRPMARAAKAGTRNTSSTTLGGTGTPSATSTVRTL